MYMHGGGKKRRHEIPETVQEDTSASASASVSADERDENDDATFVTAVSRSSATSAANDLFNYYSKSSYEYSFIDTLEEMIEDEDDIADYAVDLYVYRINHLASSPFLEVLLYCRRPSHDDDDREEEEGSVAFPQIPYRRSKKTLIEQAEKCMDELFDTTYRYKGVQVNHATRRVMLVFEKYYAQVFASVAYRERDQTADRWIWSCISEIVNDGSRDGRVVHEDVVSFFAEHESAMYLSLNGKNIDLPIVAYQCFDNESDAKRAIVSGALRENPLDPAFAYGPYYYFTDYATATASHTTTATSATSGGARKWIVRYAIFTKNVKVIPKKSEHAASGIVADVHERPRWIWTDKHDSLCVNTQWVIKEHSDQLPLGLHHL